MSEEEKCEVGCDCFNLEFLDGELEKLKGLVAEAAIDLVPTLYRDGMRLHFVDETRSGSMLSSSEGERVNVSSNRLHELFRVVARVNQLKLRIAMVKSFRESADNSGVEVTHEYAKDWLGRLRG